MKTTQRITRTAGAIGLLAALSLAVSGCGASTESQAEAASNAESSSAATEAPRVETPAPHVNKIATFDRSKVIVDASLVNAFGYDQAMIDGVSETGISVMDVIFGKHPEAATAGYRPTTEAVNGMLAELRPFVSDYAYKEYESDYSTAGEIPVNTAYKASEGAEQTYAYTTKAGDACTYSPTPFDVELTNVKLTASDSGAGPAPLFNGDVKVTVSCEEGYKIEGVRTLSFYLTFENGKYLQAAEAAYNTVEPFHKVS